MLQCTVMIRRSAHTWLEQAQVHFKRNRREITANVNMLILLNHLLSIILKAALGARRVRETSKPERDHWLFSIFSPPLPSSVRSDPLSFAHIWLRLPHTTNLTYTVDGLCLNTSVIMLQSHRQLRRMTPRRGYQCGYFSSKWLGGRIVSNRLARGLSIDFLPKTYFSTIKHFGNWSVETDD